MKPPMTITLPTRAVLLALGLLAGAALVISPPAKAGDMAGTMAADPHAQHHMMMQMPSPPLENSVVTYNVPDVPMVREDGKKVNFRDEINDGKPVIMDFIFTSCQTVCPVLSRTMSMIQQRLGADADKVHLISVSIDPEQDTPPRLAAYAKRYHAGPEWHFYTGTLADSITLQKAFDAYRGDKMNHEPATYLRRSPGQPWLRMGGFATAEDVVHAYHDMLAGKIAVAASGN